ncbi:MAG: hypothetical protein GY915_05925 [bacterium]|nr:hypothetical protein [bacterium]
MKKVLGCALGLGFAVLQVGTAFAAKHSSELIEEGRKFHQGFQPLRAFAIDDVRRTTLSKLISSRQGNVTVDGVGYTFHKLRAMGVIPSFLSDAIRDGKPMALNHSIRLAGLLALQYAVEVSPGKTRVFSLDFQIMK